MFGIASFSRELVDPARLRFQGDGVFHQGSSEGGQRFVCHFDVVAPEVSGWCLGDAIDVGKGCPSWFTVLTGPPTVLRGLGFPFVRGLKGFCVALHA